ncbi:MAG: SulP family inorganic anion transporter [Lachnospiraceae bacterium]|nr:SulP family inorganic anion transporter [Lachnospiraceae bacterium]
MKGKRFRFKDLGKDLMAGLIVALVSIPISMGYAMVAGLPPVYGLYGSLLPVLFYGLLTTSPRFVFSVDAAPAALVGAMLASLGIAYESEAAIKTVPVITLAVALWLFVFYIFGAGKLIKYISSPVMGGFITGIGLTIILMQIPKLFGGDAGAGELIELISHIIEEAEKGVNVTSLIIGILTVVIIRIFFHIKKGIPMSVVMMVVGLLLTLIFHVEDYGVKLLPAVKSGLPRITFPDVLYVKNNLENIIIGALPIALVILSETLLATNNYAIKYDDNIDNNKEILAYASSNFVSAISGCCPVNGSISRTGIADQFGVRSQIMSLSSSLYMALILMFGTGFIKYLPVPVLTGIVIAALIGIMEFDLLLKLKKVDKTEFVIFIIVMLTVLFLGTVYGVLVGILLSFFAFVRKASFPPTAVLGYGEQDFVFHSLSRSPYIKEIEHVKIYRFTGALFFANVDRFTSEIESLIEEDTEVIIVDASGIGSIDVTATERVIALYEKLKRHNIKFYITEHEQKLNEEFHCFGAEVFFEEQVIRRFIWLALEDAGYSKPYKLVDEGEDKKASGKLLAELDWAYGKEAQSKMDELVNAAIKKILENENFESVDLKSFEWRHAKGFWNALDENEFLTLLENRLSEILDGTRYKNMDIRDFSEKEVRRLKEFEKRIEKRHEYLKDKIKQGKSDKSDTININNISNKKAE